MIDRAIRFLQSAMVVLLSLALSGCSGGGGKTSSANPSEGLTIAVSGTPPNHGLAPMEEISVQPGSTVERGNVEISCPAGGRACIVSVTTEGTVEYRQSGGTPSIMLLTLAADEIEAALRSLIGASKSEIFGIGGPLATCQALDCVQPHNIYVRSTSQTPEMDLSGFDFLGRRNGVALAEKESQSELTNFFSLRAWMEHSMFLVDTARHEILGMTYGLSVIGDSTGTDPAPPETGSATWTGIMIGAVIPTDPDYEGARVDGDARISIPSFGSETDPSLDIEFTNIWRVDTEAQLADMTWDDVDLADGAFGFPRIIEAIDPGDIDIREKALGLGIYGQFFGPDHEEVGGVFIRDGINGVFGARRDE